MREGIRAEKQQKFRIGVMKNIYTVTQPCIGDVKIGKHKRYVRQSQRIQPVRTYTIRPASCMPGVRPGCQYAVNPLYGIDDEIIGGICKQNSQHGNNDFYKGHYGCSGPSPHGTSNQTYGKLWHTSQSGIPSTNLYSYSTTPSNFKAENRPKYEAASKVSSCCIQRLKSIHDATFMTVCLFSFVLTIVIILLGFISLTSKREHFQMTKMDLLSLITAPVITNIIQGLVTASATLRKRCSYKWLIITVLTCLLNLTLSVFFLYGYSDKVSLEVIIKSTAIFIFDLMFAITLFIGSIVSLSGMIRCVILLCRVIKHWSNCKRDVTKLNSSSQEIYL